MNSKELVFIAIARIGQQADKVFGLVDKMAAGGETFTPEEREMYSRSLELKTERLQRLLKKIQG